MNRLAFGLGLSLAFAGANAGVGCMACNESVCADTLWVYFAEPDEGALRDGTYEVTVTLDGGAPQTATCEIGDAGQRASCEGLDGILHTPRYDSPDNPHEVLHLFFEGGPPAQLRVEIVHDGVTVIDETLTPDYELAEPGCDADCEHATIEKTFTRA